MPSSAPVPLSPVVQGRRRAINWDLWVGRRVGRLLILRRDGFTGTARRRAMFLCRCDCGVEKRVMGQTLASGLTRSCGCWKREASRLNGSKHAKAPGVAEFNQLVGAYRIRAQEAGLVFSLTNDDLRRLFTGICEYCGAAPLQKKRSRTGRHPFWHNGIDRVDNARGYVRDNCVTCCKVCNRAKGAMSRDGFMAMALRISEKYWLEIADAFVKSYPA